MLILALRLLIRSPPVDACEYFQASLQVPASHAPTLFTSRRNRPFTSPEYAQLLQMLYSVRSERLLMEEIEYSVLFRWLVGMNMDEPVWDATVFTKNRDRLLEHDVARSSSRWSGIRPSRRS
jgi:hypothetical protein